MTEKERLIALFDDFGLECVDGDVYSQPETSGRACEHSYRIERRDDGDHVILHEGLGFRGFECAFWFNANGRFVHHEVYE